MCELRTVLTTAYASREMKGMRYSDKDKSKPGVTLPALSLLGESTPGTFLESLSADMMEDGLLSRFLAFNYDGLRLPPNELRAVELEEPTLASWKSLVTRALPYQNPCLINMKPINVEYFKTRYQETGDGEDRLKKFELECIDSINAAGDDESQRAVWNRAHLKALKIASLLAAADSCIPSSDPDHDYTPRIRLEHAVWAITTVKSDIAVYRMRLDSGDIGSDDHTRSKRLKKVLKEYLEKMPSASYKIPLAMMQQGIVPRMYLQKKVCSITAFSKHRGGAKAALDNVIKELLENGNLMELEKSKQVEAFSFHGKSYRILRLD